MDELILGWALGMVNSLLIGLFMFWLEGKREVRNALREQRREDIRTARNWAYNGKKVSLRGFDLQGANLSGKDLSGADLEDSNLEGAQMWQTNFSRANLIRANFGNTKIVGANFRQAKLHSTDFTKAIIREADFSETRLRRTKLAKAQEIVNCSWESVEIDKTTELTPELRKEIEQQLSRARQIENNEVVETQNA